MGFVLFIVLYAGIMLVIGFLGWRRYLAHRPAAPSATEGGEKP